MRRRIAVYGATEPALALLPALARRRDLELAWVYDPEARSLRRRLAWLEPGAARLLQDALTDDPGVVAGLAGLALVIDGGRPPPAAAPPGAVPPETAGDRLGLAPEPWREPRAPEAPSAPAADRLLAAALAAGERFALLRCDAGPSGAAAAPEELVARARRRAAAALRAALGAAGPLATAADGAVLALLPLDAGADASARLVPLARQAAEEVAAELTDAPRRPRLVFGYAIHPDEGRTAEALLARAARPRIRTL